MKRSVDLLLALILLLLIGGCSTTRTESSRSSFSFTYDGNTYEVACIVAPLDKGHNFLIRRDERRLVLYARDNDQDGKLDTLLAGNVTLEEANRIYQAGIAEARTKGKYREQMSARIFEMSHGGEMYFIQTYMSGSGKSYNKFIISRAAIYEETVLRDEHADGVLDEVESGECDLEECQKLYEMVLREGIREGRITRDGNAFYVNPGDGSHGISRRGHQTHTLAASR